MVVLGLAEGPSFSHSVGMFDGSVSGQWLWQWRGEEWTLPLVSSAKSSIARDSDITNARKARRRH
jgi:hypothetical protein